MRPRAIAAIAIKEIKLTFRNKILVFFLVAYPIMMLFFASILWIRSPTPVAILVGVVYSDSTVNEYTFNATLIVKVMNESEIEGTHIFNVRMYSEEKRVLDDLHAGKLDAAVVFPEGFSKNLTLGLMSSINVYINQADEYKAQISRAVLTEFLSRFSQRISTRRIEESMKYLPPGVPQEVVKPYLYGLVFPLNATYKGVVPETIRSREKLMGIYSIGMIGVQFLFSGMMQAATSIVEEREKKTLRRLLSTPMSPWEFLTGKTISILFSMVITSAVCVLFGIALGADIEWNPITNPSHIMVIVFLFFGSLLTMGIGFIISCFVKTSDAGVGVVMVIAFPLMFLSGVWMPKSMLPESIRWFADIFPLTQAIDALKEIMINGRSIVEVLPILPGLILSTLAAYVAGVIIFRWSIKKEY